AVGVWRGVGSGSGGGQNRGRGSGGCGGFYARVHFAAEDYEDRYDDVHKEENTEDSFEYLSQKFNFVDQRVPV
ncbi:hypothetical protein HDU93_003377, partial [Gonapodya sp. JEL0774]